MAEGVAQPNPKNKLSWSTAGSVKKNLPHLTSAHLPLLQENTTKRVLEIASGFGDHVLAYAAEVPEVEFHPTEYDEYLVSQLNECIEKSSKGGKVRKARKLDVLDNKDWAALLTESELAFDIVTVTNLLNVSPWSVTEALFSHLGYRTRPVLDRHHGILALYCCLKQGGRFMSDADEKFDAELRARSPDFGIRNLDDIVALAEKQGLRLESKEALGGGTNLFLQFRYT